VARQLHSEPLRDGGDDQFDRLIGDGRDVAGLLVDEVVVVPERVGDS
jgi:hypothetical protein